MATWIESHKELLNHPKVLDLANLMGWDIDQTIGKLHRLWWWCVDYAEDGDLRKHNDSRIAQSMGVAIVDAPRLVGALIQACWLEREPYFRVHDWWEYVGRFLQSKYGHYPEKWHSIRLAYAKQEYLTSPNPTSPNHKNTPSEGFATFWGAYPKKIGKGAAEKAWNKIHPSQELLNIILKAVADQKRCEQWRRDSGQFIPHPTTWLNQRRWEDEVESVYQKPKIVNPAPGSLPVAVPAICPKCNVSWMKNPSESDTCSKCEFGSVNVHMKGIPAEKAKELTA